MTFPRLFALMWFSQSKSYEADWAVNTSEAALEAWKEGIAAYPYGSEAAKGPTPVRPSIKEHSLRLAPQATYDLLGRSL